jgi:multiple sugar transport system substrate-binding protein
MGALHKKRVWLSLLAAVFLLAACDSSSVTYRLSTEKPIPLAAGQTLRILAPYEAPKEIVEAYRKKYPALDVEWTVGAGGGKEVYLQSMASEAPPDLIVVDNSLFSELSAYDVFEDMGADPEWEKQQRGWFPGLRWDRFCSADGRKRIAVPKELPAAMTFYRADIMAANGLPSEPEALAEYMEEPEQWLSMARTLKEKGHWISTWSTDPLQIFGYGRSAYQMVAGKAADDMLVGLIGAAQRLEQEQLSARLTIWDSRGQDAIRSGEIAMFYSGEWHNSILERWAPDSYHLWKMTRLPFGQYGVTGGVFFAIPKSGDNKQAAWDYIRHTMEMEMPYRTQLRSYDWLDRLPSSGAIPLDWRVSEIWFKTVQELLPSGRSPEDIAVDAKRRVESELQNELLLIRGEIESRSE